MPKFSRCSRVSSLDEDASCGFSQPDPVHAAHELLPGRVDGTPRSYLSFKIDPGQVDGMPLPRPMFEIFVFPPRWRACICVVDRVARGGLRWSDRMEDYRTEVLGLMKAQMIKEHRHRAGWLQGAVSWSERPPLPTTRNSGWRRASPATKTLLQGMLDLTDNLDGSSVVPPPGGGPA